MKASVLLLIVLAAVLAVAGCGGSGGDGNPGNPTDPGSREWSFTDGDTSTMMVWSAPVATSSGSGFSAVLRKDSSITIYSYGTIPGYATGIVDADGDITTTGGTLRAAGNVTHQSAVVSLHIPNTPIATPTMSASVVSVSTYTSHRGNWSGTYQLNGGSQGTVTFTVNEAGFASGTVDNDDSISGYINSTTGKIVLKLTNLSVGQTPWTLQGNIVTTPAPSHISAGEIRHTTLGTQLGTWTANKQ